MESVKIGPYTFEFLPDGDDPGTGLLRISSSSDTSDDLQTTAEEFQEFEQEVS